MCRRLGLALLLALIAGCRGARPSTEGTPAVRLPTPASVEEGATVLPPPRTTGEVSLEETLARRRSVRSYTNQALTWEEIMRALMWGERRSWGFSPPIWFSMKYSGITVLPMS